MNKRELWQGWSLLDRLTSKLLKRCGVRQDNVYGNGGILVRLGRLEPEHPVAYWFVYGTWLGRRLHRRWVKRAHRRIGAS